MSSPATLRAVLVDDEPLARRLLRSLLDREQDIEVVAECGDGEQAVEAVHRERPDLLFLDIQMPGMDGFQVLEALSLERLPRVIFVTAYDRYAIRAFDVHALDYLLKPFDDERLQEALRRARLDLDAAGTPPERGQADDAGFERRILDMLEDLHARGRYRDRLAITMHERTRFLPVEEIDWIEADGKYVKVHAAGHTYPFREGISVVEERLDPGRFLRIHRSRLVRIDAVREVQTWFKGEYLVVLDDGTKLTSGRAYRDNIHRLLGKT